MQNHRSKRCKLQTRIFHTNHLPHCHGHPETKSELVLRKNTAMRVRWSYKTIFCCEQRSRRHPLTEVNAPIDVTDERAFRGVRKLVSLIDKQQLWIESGYHVESLGRWHTVPCKPLGTPACARVCVCDSHTSTQSHWSQPVAGSLSEGLKHWYLDIEPAT